MKRNEDKRPTYAVYVVDDNGDSSYWTKVGAAWAHENGEGFNITLTALPHNGRLVVRKPKSNGEREAGR